MKKLYVKQKVFSVGEKFTVTDEQQKVSYYVEGSFFRIPKRFSIQDDQHREIGVVTKKIFSLLPKFYLEVNGKEEIVLSKELTFFRSKYSIYSHGIRIEGNWWDMDFDVYSHGRRAASIAKRWFSWGDTYEIIIEQEELEQLIVSLVIAIDCVKSDEAASSSSSV